MPAEAPAAPTPAAPVSAPAPPMRGDGPNMAAAMASFDKLAREPSSSPAVVPDHPSDTARKKNEANKTAPKTASQDPKPKLDAGAGTEGGTDRANDTDPSSKVEDVAENADAGTVPKSGEPQKPKKHFDFLREELAKQKARAEAYEKELTALKAPKEDPEKKELSEKLTAAEKRAQEREDELRFANYERSEEYQSKYFKPYVEAFNTARQKITELDVVEIKREDPNTGEERILQAGRAAIPEDFDRIAMMPDGREARKLAKQLFGEDYTIAMAHREKVMELNSSRQNALNEQRTRGAEREKAQLEQRTKAQTEAAKQREQLWSAANKEFAEKHKDWFEPIEGDEIGNKMLTSDMAVTDALFGDVSHLPLEKVIKLHSEMRNRAAAAGRLEHLLKQTRKQLAEATEKLKGFEGSEPKEGEGVAAPTAPGSGRTLDSVFADLDKRSRPASSFF